MLDGQVENLPLSSLRFQYIMLLFYPVDYGNVGPTKFYAPSSLLPSPADLPYSVLTVSNWPAEWANQ
jgi:alkyl hydroperoxide reductase subunit AhpC